MINQIVRDAGEKSASGCNSPTVEPLTQIFINQSISSTGVHAVVPRQHFYWQAMVAHIKVLHHS